MRGDCTRCVDRYRFAPWLLRKPPASPLDRF